MEKSLLLTKTNLGSAVITNKVFNKGDEIIEFKGEKIRKKDLPPLKKLEDDRFLQVGKDLYIGPSKGFDDFINHSCNPNAGILFHNGKVLLVAIKEILIGEEVTFDYSTTMDEDDWQMQCLCRSMECRGVIKDFKYLEENIMQKYIELGIVPRYILDGLTP